MQNPPFAWPNEFLYVALGLAAIAAIIPWFFVIPKKGLWVSLSLSAVATITWIAYEGYLHSIAREGDPLIRIDLFLLLPILIAAWGNCVRFWFRLHHTAKG